MSVLNPLSQIGGPPNPGKFRFLVLGLLLGLAAGGALGFFLGRLNAPVTTPEPADGVVQAPGEPGAPDGSGAALATMVATGAHSPVDGGTVAGNQAPARIPAPPLDNVSRLDISITGSLYTTLASQIENRQADILNAQLGRVLLWWMDLRRDVLPGDRIQALYEPMPGPGELRLLAIRYSSEKRNLLHRAYFFQPTGAPYGRYYDEQGQEVEQRLADSPIKDYEQVTELMNSTGRRHHGVDFKTNVGTPVTAPFRAQVTRVNWHPHGNGNCLELRYFKDGNTAMFLHLTEVLPVARPGAVIEAGTEVARTGNTGHSTAPHLHYEMHGPGGQLLNPFQVHQIVRLRLEGEPLKAFEKKRDELDQRLVGDGAKL